MRTLSLFSTPLWSGEGKNFPPFWVLLQAPLKRKHENFIDIFKAILICAFMFSNIEKDSGPNILSEIQGIFHLLSDLVQCLKIHSYFSLNTRVVEDPQPKAYQTEVNKKLYIIKGYVKVSKSFSYRCAYLYFSCKYFLTIPINETNYHPELLNFALLMVPHGPQKKTTQENVMIVARKAVQIKLLHAQWQIQLGHFNFVSGFL